MARNWKPALPTAVSFSELGTWVEGELLGQTEFQYRTGAVGCRYVLRDEDGNAYAFNATAVLRQQMAAVSVGDYIRVEYVGDFQTGNGMMAKDFKVLVDHDYRRHPELVDYDTGEIMPAEEMDALTDG